MVDMEFLLEHLNRINNEVQKVVRVIQAIQDGVPFTEAFDEELFLERDEWKSVRSEIVVIMEHLLKFRFSTVNRSLHTWFSQSIAFKRREIIENIEWDEEDQSYDKNVVVKVLNKYENLYKNAAKSYEQAAGKYSDLKPGLKHIPVECPWTLWDLVSTPFDDLLAMIPAVDEEDKERLHERMELIIDYGHEI